MAKSQEKAKKRSEEDPFFAKTTFSLGKGEKRDLEHCTYGAAEKSFCDPNQCRLKQSAKDGSDAFFHNSPSC